MDSYTSISICEGGNMAQCVEVLMITMKWKFSYLNHGHDYIYMQTIYLYVRKCEKIACVLSLSKVI